MKNYTLGDILEASQRYHGFHNFLSVGRAIQEEMALNTNIAPNQTPLYRLLHDIFSHAAMHRPDLILLEKHASFPEWAKEARIFGRNASSTGENIARYLDAITTYTNNQGFTVEQNGEITLEDYVLDFFQIYGAEASTSQRQDISRQIDIDVKSVIINDFLSWLESSNHELFASTQKIRFQDALNIPDYNSAWKILELELHAQPNTLSHYLQTCQEIEARYPEGYTQAQSSQDLVHAMTQHALQTRQSIHGHDGPEFRNMLDDYAIDMKTGGIMPQLAMNAVYMLNWLRAATKMLYDAPDTPESIKRIFEKISSPQPFEGLNIESRSAFYSYGLSSTDQQLLVETLLSLEANSLLITGAVDIDGLRFDDDQGQDHAIKQEIRDLRAISQQPPSSLEGMALSETFRIIEMIGSPPRTPY